MFSREDLQAYEKAPQSMDAPDSAFWENKTPEPKAETKATPAAESKAESVESASTAAAETPSDESESKVDGSEVGEAEATTAEVAQPEGEVVDEAASTETEPVRRGSAQERIEELVAERNALRKYGEYLREHLDQVRKQPETPKEVETAAAVAPKEDPAPKLEDFGYDPVAFAKAQTDWIDRQVDRKVSDALNRNESKRQVEAAQRAEVEIRQAFTNRVSEFKKDHKDFDVVMGNPTLPALHKDAATQVVRSENGPAIAYHLGQNPDLATRIARMDSAQQLMAIGRIEAQLLAEPVKAPAAKAVPQKRTVTQAPPPPKPVSSNSVVDRPSELMSMDEWVAADRARKIADKEQKRKLREALRR
jgi:hypothetical protein